MTSNLSITPLSRGSQAFHSTLLSRKTGRRNFNSTTAEPREAAMCNYQNQWRAEESAGIDLPLQNSKRQNFLIYVWTEIEGLRIINLPSISLAEGLAEVLKAGICSPYFEVIVETLSEGKFGLHFPFTGEYDYRLFRSSFEQRIEFLAGKYFLKTPFSPESEAD